MLNQPQEIQHQLQGFNGITIPLNSVRNVLWHPFYNRWIDEGGFDYRTFIRKMVLSTIARHYEGENRIPNTSNMRIPRTMGDPSKITAQCMENFLQIYDEKRVDITIPPTILDICPEEVSSVVFCDLIVTNSFNIDILFLDVFPEDNVWSIGSYEEALLVRTAASLEEAMKKMTGDEIPAKTQAGVLNLYTGNFLPSVLDEGLGPILEVVRQATAGDRSLEEGKEQREKAEILRQEGMI